MMRMRNSIILAAFLLIGAMLPMSFGSFVASPNPYTLTNTVIDAGQISVANSLVSGGILGGNSGQWTWVSTNQSNNVVGNTVITYNTIDGMAFSPNGALLYVAEKAPISSAPGFLQILNTTTDKVVNTIRLGAGVSASSIVINSSGTQAYLGVSSSNILVINTATNTVVNTITTATPGPYNMAFNPNGQFIYAISSDGDFFQTVNTISNTVSNTINFATGMSPSGLAVNPSGTKAYVLVQSPGAMDTISTAANAVVNTIVVAPGSGGITDAIAVSPSGNFAYVSSHETGGGGQQHLNIIDLSTNDIVHVIDLPTNATSLALNPSGSLLYAALSYSATNTKNVIVISTVTNSIIGSFNTSTSNPDLIAVSPRGSKAYVGYYNTRNVSSIVNLSSTNVQPLLGSQSLGLVIDAVNNNTLTFTFNGVQYNENTASHTIAGTWSLYGFAEDNSTNLYGFGSSTALSVNSLKVFPALGDSVSPTSASLTNGQSLTLTGTVTGGTGTANYTYQWYESIDGSAYSAYTGGTSNTLSFGSLPVGHTYSFKLQATDTGTTTHMITNSSVSTVTVSSGGGGGGGSTTTTSTSTVAQTSTSTATTTTTSTVPSTTTTVPPAISNSTGTANLTVSSSSSGTVNYVPGNSSIVISTNSNTPVETTFTISNATSVTPPAPSQYTKIIALNLSSSNPNTTMEVVMSYPCSDTSSNIHLFKLVSGTWTQAASTVNSTSCTSSASVPSGTVALMYYAPAATTTAVPATTTVPQSQGSSVLYGAAAVIIIIIVAAAYALTRRKKQFPYKR
jgi:DNA-binding beta-propeller fold protein YncE